MHGEQQYLDLLTLLLESGNKKGDRTGTGTRSVFGPQMRFDLTEGFPLLTTKKLHMKSIKCELLWMLRGDTNVKWLNEQGVHIWDEWADENGELGPVYGKQWRKWQAFRWGEGESIGTEWEPAGWREYAIDQVSQVIGSIKRDPDSRRHMITAWNPADIPKMALAPCHCLFQFYVAEGKLSCQLYQRSADIFLGVPFNIASYALLTLMVAQVCDLAPGEFIHTFGDLHLYNNHREQAQEQLSRSPYPFPQMKLNREVKDVFAFTPRDFVLEGYKAHPHIEAPVAV